MRVISGIFKGRKLMSPPDNVRPTLDRVRETLFDIIQFNVADSVFFDLFAGSGANGIEAMSRGAKEVVFCDNSRSSRDVLYKNLEFTSGAKVWECGFKDALKKYPPDTFDFIFIDPPFDTGFGLTALEIIFDRKLLKSGGTAIWEHARDTGAPEAVGGLKLVRKKDIGSVTLSFYKLCDD